MGHVSPGTLQDRYLSLAGGIRLQAAVLLAEDLMRGDPASFKAGYTLPNAAIAAAEMFDLSRAAVEGALEDRA